MPGAHVTRQDDAHYESECTQDESCHSQDEGQGELKLVRYIAKSTLVACVAPVAKREKYINEKCTYNYASGNHNQSSRVHLKAAVSSMGICVVVGFS